MKKICWLIVFLSIGNLTKSFCQRYTTPFKQGQIDLNIGVGLLPVLDFNPSVTLDIGVSDNFSIGGMAAYGGTSTYRNQNEQEQLVKDYSLALRMAMHHTELKYWDYYGGIMGGYKFNTGDIEKKKQHENLFLWTCILGTRFHFNDHLGMFGELSYNGHSFISVGINFRL